MTTEGGEEPAEEYESDPEGSLLPSAMRRREASDDEGEVGEGADRRVMIGSDRESDGQGGAGGHTPRGRRLWESKDNKAWVHDRFEEMSLQDARYNERKVFKRRFRGRGKNRANDHGYVGENKTRAYEDNNSQNQAPKTVRGRGPRRYQPLRKSNNEMQTSQKKQSVKSFEPISNTNSMRPSSNASNVWSDPVPLRKQVFSSSLSSASPPFYPSGSSNQDISIAQKREGQSESTNINPPSSVLMEEKSSSPQATAALRGKAVIDPIGQDKLYSDDSIRPASAKSLGNLPLYSSESSASVNPTQSVQSRIQGRALTIPGQSNYEPNSSSNQVNRGSVQTQISVVQQKPALDSVQPALLPSSPQLSQRLNGGTQASSAPQTPSFNSSDIGEEDSPPGSSKSKTALVSKGKTGVVQGSGRGSFMYGGAQVIGVTGAMGGGPGDQSFPATPALLPFMQFRGQHPGGLGVPAVGMALPGYVAQPGFGNSEMTWVPVLAGAPGAFGASYPYITLDGSYYARPSGQISSSSTPSKEASTSKSTNAWKPSPQKSENVNDEFGQRQNKPRRSSFECLTSETGSSCFCINSLEAEEDHLERKALIGSEKQVLRVKDVLEENQSLAFHLEPKIVVLRVSMHCYHCARRVEKHIAKMEGVTSFEVDLESKKVVVMGDVLPFEVLESVSKVKSAELWPSS
ncbi:hypothetical protein QJS10_CPB22g00965 [Acorus calamus]|uniref:HMA domain-containing protein n=1 Tax=Acorus calamus TaxID=4465 RepID=A0AAV9C3X9_ACOCL|nr:hypothetical protein QJS10_CPB22g00965 [Acorus calamus]